MVKCVFGQQYSPDQVEPDNPSLRGKELLRKRNSERTRDPHGLCGESDQLSDVNSRGGKPTLRILKYPALTVFLICSVLLAPLITAIEEM